MSVAKVLYNVLTLYFYLIIIRVFLTWIPSINWYNQPFKSLREISDIYLDIFRKFIPPYGGIDFSPIIAMLVLQMLIIFVTNIAYAVFG